MSNPMITGRDQANNEHSMRSNTPRLVPHDFIHPEDDKALQTMQQIPLFPQLVKGFVRLGIEARFETMAMAEKILLGPDQLPEVYNLVPPICRFFGIPEPMVFLEAGPPNAYTLGSTKVFLVMTTGLLHSVGQNELRAVLAHECGHIACQHMLYHTMAQLLQAVGESSLPFVAELSAPVRLALLYWSRRSEFSADRAAALYMRGADSMVEAFMRLAGGTTYLPWQLNRQAYLKQAEGFNRLLESKWNDALQSWSAMQQSHPLLAVRAKELDLWCRGPHFSKLLDGLDKAGLSGGTMLCPSCKQDVPDVSRFCHHCGNALASNPNTIHP